MSPRENRGIFWNQNTSVFWRLKMTPILTLYRLNIPTPLHATSHKVANGKMFLSSNLIFLMALIKNFWDGFILLWPAPKNVCFWSGLGRIIFKDIFFEVNKSQKTAFMISKTNKMGVEKIFMKKLKSKI